MHQPFRPFLVAIDQDPTIRQLLMELGVLEEKASGRFKCFKAILC